MPRERAGLTISLFDAVWSRTEPLRGEFVPSHIPKSEFYRLEAERLITMADCAIFEDVRDELCKMARQYERLARSAEQREDREAAD